MHLFYNKKFSAIKNYSFERKKIVYKKILI